jgi:hypothetical protein
MKFHDFIANLFTNFRYHNVNEDIYENAFYIVAKYKVGNEMQLDANVIDTLASDLMNQINEISNMPVREMVRKSSIQYEMNKEFVTRFCYMTSLDPTIITNLVRNVPFTSYTEEYVKSLNNIITNDVGENMYSYVMNALCLTEDDL